MTGGAVFMNASNSGIYFYSTSFIGNKASSKVHVSSTVSGQSDGQGGAISLWNLNSAIHFYNCWFTTNMAGKYGGAIYMNQANGNGVASTFTTNVIRLTNVTMQNNIATVDGGGIYASNGNSMTVLNSQLSNNVASSGRGGAIFLSQNNYPVSVVGSALISNAAIGSGGAVYADNGFNSMVIDTTRFVTNTANGLGGAIALNTGNALFVDNAVNFVSNRVIGAGGALSISSSTLTFMAGYIVTFLNNSAESSPSQAQGYGGAILLSSSALRFESGVVSFLNNTADTKGSGMYIASSSTCSVVLANISYTSIVFANNVCRRQGGTVYWIADTVNPDTKTTQGGQTQFFTPFNFGNGYDLSPFPFTPYTCSHYTFHFNPHFCSLIPLPCSNLLTSYPSPSLVLSISINRTNKIVLGHQPQHFQKIRFQNNIAPSGMSNTVTTQLRSMTNNLLLKTSNNYNNYSHNSSIKLTNYHSFLYPAPSFALRDVYGIINTTDFSTRVVATVLPNFYCGGGSRLGYLSGLSTVTASAGIVTFDSLSVYCYPGE